MRLTKETQAKAAALLTRASSSYFKILFDYRIEDNYKLSTIDSVINCKSGKKFSRNEKLQLYRAFCGFIESTTNMTYTEVDECYGRTRDQSDIATDIEFGNEEFPIDHYQMAKNGIGKYARIHGYIRNQVFIVKRIDWAHRFHESKKKRWCVIIILAELATLSAILWYN